MSTREARCGVLLIQLGTPDSPRRSHVRRFLHEFLSDPRVLDMNALARSLLLYGVILPFRPRRAAVAYTKIWTEAGSPLAVHSRAFGEALGKELGEDFRVALGMRYGNPSLEEALQQLAAVERLIVLPLFPQYAESSTGSALARVRELAGAPFAQRVLGPFYRRAEFISALAEVARPELEQLSPDHVLMSYHGLPQRQIRTSDPSGAHCLAHRDCCEWIGPANANCYRAQCYATSRALAEELELHVEWSVSFQSRLGLAPWIRPFTDHVLPQLAGRGVRRLAVICPSFVADCLETLEEIGIRAAEQWDGLGGEQLSLIPCLNAHPSWVGAVAGWVRCAAQDSSGG